MEIYDNEIMNFENSKEYSYQNFKIIMGIWKKSRQERLQKSIRASLHLFALRNLI